MLFRSPEEAGIAMQLSMKPEPLRRIFSRVRKSGISIDELRQCLDRMMHKGTILTVEEGYGETHYCNAEFSMGGIFNFQINRLSKELLADYHQYLAERRSKARMGAGGGLPLRTIPVEESIPLPEKYRVGDYDDVIQIFHWSARRFLLNLTNETLNFQPAGYPGWCGAQILYCPPG